MAAPKKRDPKTYNTSGLKKRVYDSEWVPRDNLSIPKNPSTRIARPIPVEVSEQNDIANLMWKWIEENPCEINLDEFCLSQRYRPYKVYKLRHSNEYFADVLHMCLSKIMGRMGKEVWNKGGDSKMYTDMMRMWHENYKEAMRDEIAHRIEASAVAASKATASGSLVYNVVDIEMDKVEETDVVTKSLERDGKKRNEFGTRRRDETMAQEVSTTVVSETLDG